MSWLMVFPAYRALWCASQEQSRQIEGLHRTIKDLTTHCEQLAARPQTAPFDLKTLEPMFESVPGSPNDWLTPEYPA